MPIITRPMVIGGDHAFVPLPRPGAYGTNAERLFSHYPDALVTLEFPLMGLACAVLKGGFTERLIRHMEPEFVRLGRINQFGNLDHPAFTQVVTPNPFLDRTRQRHTFEVQAVVVLLAWHHRLDLVTTNTARFVGIVHDLRTSAIGDDLKTLDPTLFDEDLLFERIREEMPWVGNHFMPSQRISWEPALDGIHGTGLMGDIQQLADWVYVAQDCSAYLGADAINTTVGFSRPIRQLARLYPRLGSVWEHTTILNNRLVADARALAPLLMMRAFLIRDFYCAKSARGPRRLVGQVFADYWLRTDRLSLEQLALKYDMQGFSSLLHEIEGFRIEDVRANESWRVESFSSWPQAQARELQLLNEGVALVRAEYVKPPRPGIHVHVFHQGAVGEFASVLPKKAALITRIVSGVERFDVLSLGRCTFVHPQKLHHIRDMRMKQLHTASLRGT